MLKQRSKLRDEVKSNREKSIKIQKYNAAKVVRRFYLAEINFFTEINLANL